MKIKELFLKKYGPLQDQSFVLGGGFNLLVGANDRGKTLTIDALVKILLGSRKREARVFEQIDRVGEKPEGYAVLVNGNGRELKIPEKGSLTELTGLTPLECRNIFVIRNSDLTIADEDAFYTDVTDRLTGLRSKEIVKITDHLREAARITADGHFSNTREHTKLKDRLGEAKTITEELAALQQLAEERGCENLEEELAGLEKEREKVAAEREGLDNARKREALEKTAAALGELTDALDTHEEYGRFQEEEMHLWRDTEKDVQRLEQEIKGRELLGREKEKDLQEITEEMSVKEQELQVLEQRRHVLDGEIRPDILECRRKSEAIETIKAQSRRLTLPAVACTALSGAALVASAVHPAWWFFLLTGVFLLTSALLWWPKIALAVEEGRFAALLEKVKQNLSRLGLSAEDLQDALGKINAFREECDRGRNELNRLAARRDAVQGSIEELQNRKVPRLKAEKERNEALIEGIKTRSGVNRLDHYAAGLHQKRKCQGIIDRQQGILKSIVGESGKDLESDLAFWKQRLEELREYGQKAPDTPYDEKKASLLAERAKWLEGEIQERRERQGSFKKRLAELESRANQLLQPEPGFEYQPCQNVLDLDVLKEGLQRFVARWEHRKRLAEEAVAILDEIAAEEMEKVSELFGEGSAISGYMRQITGGLYPCVLFDREERSVLCRRSDGTLLEAEKLSGGSYDQLYFSVRLALGEKLLGQGRAFFVLDDPFIKADHERLCRQLKSLQKVAESGWQVIYFTAKKEVREALEEEIENGGVNCQEMIGSLA